MIEQFQTTFVEPRLSNKEEDIDPETVVSTFHEYYQNFYENYIQFAKGKFKCTFINFLSYD